MPRVSIHIGHAQSIVVNIPFQGAVTLLVCSYNFSLHHQLRGCVMNQKCLQMNQWTSNRYMDFNHETLYCCKWHYFLHAMTFSRRKSARHKSKMFLRLSRIIVVYIFMLSYHSSFIKTIFKTYINHPKYSLLFVSLYIYKTHQNEQLCTKWATF